MEKEHTAQYINRHGVIYALDTFCICIKNKGDSFYKERAVFYFT